jgi:hypothetical protein
MCAFVDSCGVEYVKGGCEAGLDKLQNKIVADAEE